ncbi:MAG: glycine zipper 2TM domain-containing protein [Burkholderiales bacterium]|nr:glycine zipper 2TM domain-containing protein [Burkholderiales bacterium]
METASAFSKPSPLMNIAAVAVIVASLVAVAAVTGLIPSAHSEKQEAVAATEKTAAPNRGAVDPAKPGPMAAASCAQCGVIASIRAVEAPGEASGLGAVAGGVAGAVVGSQLGKGNGRTALGVLGAAGGAYAGHEVEKSIKKHTAWRVTVRMEDGTTRTVSQPTQPVFAVGDKVKLINGALAARG